MNRVYFDKLDIYEQIKYVNENLSKGETVTSVAKNVGIGRNTISDRFKKYRYRYNNKNNQYEQVTLDNTQSHLVISSNANEEYEQVLLSDNTLGNPSIKRVLSRIDLLNKILDDYENKNNAIDVNEELTIVFESNEYVRTTIQVEKNILDEWRNYCSKWHFDNKELLSKALQEFMVKYKK